MLNCLWKNLKWLKLFCVGYVFLGIGFSHISYAGVEVSVHGGIYLNKDIKLTDISKDQLKDSQTKLWMLGGDVIYQLPVPRLSAGLRYQYYWISDGAYSSPRPVSLAGPFNMNIHRIAFLLNYKVVDVDPESHEGFFVGNPCISGYF